MAWFRLGDDPSIMPKVSGWYPVMDEQRHVFCAYFDIDKYHITWEEPTKINNEFVGTPVAFWENQKKIIQFNHFDD